MASEDEVLGVMDSFCGVAPTIGPVVPPPAAETFRARPSSGRFDCHSIAPKTPSPAGSTAEVTSARYFVSRASRMMTVEETGVPPSPPLETAG